jgi:L-amino acid N-acyltransferase YncA
MSRDTTPSPLRAVHPGARMAGPADAARIAEIYNQGIDDRVATFETELRTEADILAWFDRPYPIVVVEAAGRVDAFAALSSYRDRACYAGIAEFSVYVAREVRGQGAGRAAMTALLAAAEAAGFWKLVSRVFVENEGSRRLLAGVGFREVGIYEKHGQLDGVWRDVVIVERLIPANLVGHEDGRP